MVFVLDCFRVSMQRPSHSAIAKEADGALPCGSLGRPDDTFQIIRFSQDASSLGSAPIPATRDNVRRGVRYLRGLKGTGGTEMIEGIKAALDFPHDERRVRIVSFWTDGYIGNEAQIFAAIEKRLGAARLFSFGIGSSVNRFLIEGMARMGRGAVAYVGLNESSVEAVDDFYRRAERPALSDVRIDWGSLEVTDVYPRQLPDLMVGRPVLVTGRYRGRGPATIRVRGRMGDQQRIYDLTVEEAGEDSRHPALPCLWARRKIAHLSDLQMLQPSDELRQEITAVSLRHGVQCQYTSFVAVDSMSKTEGDHGVTVPQPVPVPRGVKYETTITK
jgi:Ca-activated chloride channel family protein